MTERKLLLHIPLGWRSAQIHEMWHVQHDSCLDVQPYTEQSDRALLADWKHTGCHAGSAAFYLYDNHSSQDVVVPLAHGISCQGCP